MEDSRHFHQKNWATSSPSPHLDGAPREVTARREARLPGLPPNSLPFKFLSLSGSEPLSHQQSLSW